jgi:SAM-dependent methyltransferase
VTGALPRLLFGAGAAGYDAAYDAPGAPGQALRDRLATVLELAGDGPGDAVDAGMGAGRLVLQLAGRKWQASGADPSPEMLALAQARLPEARERLVLGTIEALPFLDGSFDLAVATGVLEYADDLEAALSELARVLRPGGRAIVSLPNWWSVSVLVRRSLLYPLARRAGRPAPPAPHRLVRPGKLRRLLVGAGLRPSGTYCTSFRPRALRPFRLHVLAAQLVFEAERLAP